MSDPCCGKCKFVYEMKDQMACRRFPPNAQALIVPRQSSVMAGAGMVAVEETRSMFPNVRPEWVCGEFALKVKLVS